MPIEPTAELVSQTLLLPVAFANIGEKTYYLFGIANALSIPIVWAFYPESNQRTLEEMDLLFAADTPWTWDAEANFERLKKENPEIAHDAHRGHLVADRLSQAEKRTPHHGEAHSDV
jgi:hypothetical protein